MVRLLLKARSRAIPGQLDLFGGVKAPGSRGGHYYVTDGGEIRYGDRPVAHVTPPPHQPPPPAADAHAPRYLTDGVECSCGWRHKGGGRLTQLYAKHRNRALNPRPVPTSAGPAPAPPTPVFEADAGEGLWYRVWPHTDGYAPTGRYTVTLHDADAGESIGHRTFPTQDAATDWAAQEAAKSLKRTQPPRPEDAGERRLCPQCHGQGRVHYQAPRRGKIPASVEECGTCRGSGWVGAVPIAPKHDPEAALASRRFSAVGAGGAKKLAVADEAVAALGALPDGASAVVERRDGELLRYAKRGERWFHVDADGISAALQERSGGFEPKMFHSYLTAGETVTATWRPLVAPSMGKEPAPGVRQWYAYDSHLRPLTFGTHSQMPPGVAIVHHPEKRIGDHRPHSRVWSPEPLHPDVVEGWELTPAGAHAEPGDLHLDALAQQYDAALTEADRKHVPLNERPAVYPWLNGQSIDRDIPLTFEHSAAVDKRIDAIREARRVAGLDAILNDPKAYRGSVKAAQQALSKLEREHKKDPSWTPEYQVNDARDALSTLRYQAEHAIKQWAARRLAGTPIAERPHAELAQIDREGRQLVKQLDPPMASEWWDYHVSTSAESNAVRARIDEIRGGKVGKAVELAELLGKSPLDLARTLAEAPPTLTPETRGWLAGVQRFLAKAAKAVLKKKAPPAPRPNRAASPPSKAAAAAKFHRELKTALGQGNAAETAAAAKAPHRLVTVHDGDPTSPGHTVRMVRHPKKPGVWRFHDDDLDRARELLGGKKKGNGGKVKVAAG